MVVVVEAGAAVVVVVVEVLVVLVVVVVSGIATVVVVSTGIVVVVAGITSCVIVGLSESPAVPEISNPIIAANRRLVITCAIHLAIFLVSHHLDLFLCHPPYFSSIFVRNSSHSTRDFNILSSSRR